MIFYSISLEEYAQMVELVDVRFETILHSRREFESHTPENETCVSKTTFERGTRMRYRIGEYAQMVELVDTEVSKSSASRLAGSIPALGTIERRINNWYLIIENL